MAGVNKVILVGNLGNDPEVKYMPSGGAVVNISIATSEQWKDKQTGERREKTEWHRVVLFNRLGEIAGEYLRKGSKVYIEGRLQTRKWEKNGVDMYTTEIVGDTMQMLDSRGGGQGAGAPQGGGGGYSQPQGGGSSRPQQQPQGGGYDGGSNQGGGKPAQGGGNQPPPAFDDFEDDIPF